MARLPEKQVNSKGQQDSETHIAFRLFQIFFTSTLTQPSFSCDEGAFYHQTMYLVRKYESVYLMLMTVENLFQVLDNGDKSFYIKE